MHESILIYRSFRYFKWAAAVVLVSGLAYAFHQPLGPPNGGTWLGYILGVTAAGLMVWLAWFGVQKRRYGVGKAPLEEWMSAHVYLGGALAFVATLHAGFQLGWNIHTLLYLLMMVTIISGVFGLYFYMRYPRLLTQNRQGLTSELMFSQIAELDLDIRQIAMKMDDATNALALKVTQDTLVGGSVIQQLRGYDSNCPTTHTRELLEAQSSGEHDVMRRQLLARLIRKEDLLKRIRRDIQIRCLLKIWLYFHIPFSIAALAALFVHIIAVFYYW